MNKKRLIKIILGTTALCFLVYVLIVVYMINSTPGGAKVEHNFYDYYANIVVSGDTLRIVDDRTNLNGFTIKKIVSNPTITDAQFENVKIIITDCSKLENSPGKIYKIKSDCAFFNPSISKKVDGVEYAIIDPIVYNYYEYQGMNWVNYLDGEDILPPGVWMPVSSGDNLTVIKNYYFFTTKDSLYGK